MTTSRLARRLAATVTATVAALALGALAASGGSPEPPPAEHSSPPTTLAAAPAHDGALEAASRAAVEAEWGAVAYRAHVEAVAAYQARAVAVQAARDEVAREQAAAEAAAAEAAAYSAATAQTGGTSTGGVGACTGFNVPDYIIQRESNGDPNAVNPSSGAIGCTQTLPSHYGNGGTCAGLDMYSIDGQRACTDALLANGGLAHWSATR